MSAPDLPTTVTEIVLPGVVEPDGLLVQERPVPDPAAGQALVQMLATGISFAEQGMRRGRYPGQPAFPFVPGYDLVGVVVAVGPGVDTALVGRRVAAATKTGGWATHTLVDARTLVDLPDGVDPGEAETLVVNGITAKQMLDRARVRRGQTILVHGASGGVGTTLVQLARHAGVRVLGTASPRHHDALRELGAEPIDYADPDLVTRVHELAPGGVAAVFDHLGPESATRSFSLLARGGTLVAYGTAALLDEPVGVVQVFASMLGRIALWSVLPNGRRASFYNFWGGKGLRPAPFRARQAADLSAVLALLQQGVIHPQVAARFPLREAAKAMELAESRTVRGKVVLVP